MFFTALLFFGGCELQTVEETTLFQQAERSFTLGDYDGASEMYREFLRVHPLSPLAETAEQRIATIERELDAILGRRGAPAPVYASPYSTLPGAEEESPSFRAVRAPQLPTLD
ncbi:MAG: hypothetical protein ACJA1R_002201 [Flavobacteriales bacterium]|jgi:hypothetical protein